MAQYNPNFSYFLSRLQGVSLNYFRVESQQTSSATAGKLLRFSLPSNCLLNTKSIALMLNADANGVAAKGGRLPSQVSSLVDRYEISSGGIQIAQGLNSYNVFKKAKDNLCGDYADDALSHPDIVRAISGVDGFGSLGTAVLSGTLNESYASTNGATQFAIKNWEGFLGSVAPSVLDTSLLNDLVLTVYLAGNEVLTSSAGVGLDGAGAADITDAGALGATYNVNNYHLVVETIGMADAVLDEMVARRIADVGYIEMNFKNFTGSSDSHTGTTRFSCSSASLDRIWVVYRDASYDTQAPPKTCNGFKTSALPTGQYDQGVYGTDREKYIGAFFNFKERLVGATPATYQISLNNSFIPQMKASSEQMLLITKNSLPTDNESKRKKVEYSLDQYRNNYFAQCIRLNLPGSEEINQICGIDLRGVNLNAFLTTTGLVSGCGVMIVCETTSTLRVGSGRAMEIIA